MGIGITNEDTPMSGLGKGLVIGGFGLAGLYGLDELRRFIVKKFFLKPEIYPEDSTIKFDIPQLYQKKGNLEKKALVPEFMYGVGIPLGAFGAYKVIQYLRDKEEEFKIKSRIRRIENIQEKQSMMKDPEIDSIIKQAFMIKPAVLGIAMDTLNTYLPILYGSLAGLGALAGWHGMKYYMRPEKYQEDILDVPELVFEASPTPQNYSLDVLRGKTMRGKNILKKEGSGWRDTLEKWNPFYQDWNPLYKIPKDISNTYDDVKSTYENIKSVSKDVSDFAKEPFSYLAKNPSTLASIMGLGSIANLPGTILNQYGMHNLGKKMDHPIEKNYQNLSRSIANSFKMEGRHG